MKTPQIPPLAGMSPLGAHVDVDRVATLVQMMTMDELHQFAEQIYANDHIRAGDLEHALSTIAQDAYHRAQEEHEQKFL
jgi:hypothetical protein